MKFHMAARTTVLGVPEGHTISVGGERLAEVNQTYGRAAEESGEAFGRPSVFWRLNPTAVRIWPTPAVAMQVEIVLPLSPIADPAEVVDLEALRATRRYDERFNTGFTEPLKPVTYITVGGGGSGGGAPAPKATVDREALIRKLEEVDAPGYTDQRCLIYSDEASVLLEALREQGERQIAGDHIAGLEDSFLKVIRALQGFVR